MEKKPKQLSHCLQAQDWKQELAIPFSALSHLHLQTDEKQHSFCWFCSLWQKGIFHFEEEKKLLFGCPPSCYHQICKKKAKENIKERKKKKNKTTSQTELRLLAVMLAYERLQFWFISHGPVTQTKVLVLKTKENSIK